MIGCVGIFCLSKGFFFLILGGNGQRRWAKIFFIGYHGLICKLFLWRRSRINILGQILNFLCGSVPDYQIEFNGYIANTEHAQYSTLQMQQQTWHACVITISRYFICISWFTL